MWCRKCSERTSSDAKYGSIYLDWKLDELMIFVPFSRRTTVTGTGFHSGNPKISVSGWGREQTGVSSTRYLLFPTDTIIVTSQFLCGFLCANKSCWSSLEVTWPVSSEVVAMLLWRALVLLALRLKLVRISYLEIRQFCLYDTMRRVDTYWESHLGAGCRYRKGRYLIKNTIFQSRGSIDSDSCSTRQLKTIYLDQWNSLHIVSRFILLLLHRLRWWYGCDGVSYACCQILTPSNWLRSNSGSSSFIYRAFLNHCSTAVISYLMHPMRYLAKGSENSRFRLRKRRRIAFLENSISNI